MRVRFKWAPGPRALFVAILALLLCAKLFLWPAVEVQAADPVWSLAETIALTSSGVGVTRGQLTITGGRAAAIWLENDTSVRAAFRPLGGSFATSQTLDTQTTVRGPSIAVGPDGKAIAVWAGQNNPGPARTVAVADLAAGTTVFGSPATIHTSGTSQNPDDTQVAIDAAGATLIVFAGQGTSGYWRIWSAERAAGGGAFSVTSRTGNFEVGGLRLGAAPSGAAFAYAWGIAQGVNHKIIGPRRASNTTWSPEASLSPYCCGTIAQGPGSLVVDGSDNAYFTVDVCCNGGAPGPNFVRVNSDGTVPQGAINPDAAAFSAPASSSVPKVVVDSAGNAVMAWIRPATGELYAAYRPAGPTATFGTPELIAAGIGPTNTVRHAITMDSSGNAIIAWKDACVSSVCTLKSKTRPVGSATTFGSALTVATNVREDSPLSIASDGANNVGVLWRDSVSPINLKTSFMNTAVPDHLTITSSTTTLVSGATRVLTAELRDSNGNVVTSDSSTVVTFTQTSGTGSVTGLGSSTAASGIASKTVTGNLAGAVTITATATGLTSGTTTFTVVVGAAHHVTITSSTATLASGVTRILTAEIRDAAGNVVTSDSSTSVTFAQTSGTGSVTGLGSSTAASGVASKTVTGSLSGAVTITATATGLTSGTTTFTVVVGAAHHVTITSSTATLASGVTRVLTAEIRDAADNVVTSDSSTSVTFAQTSGTGSVSGLGSSTAASGVASKTVTGNLPGAVTITATASGLTSGTTTFTVVVGVAHHLTFTSSTATLVSGATRVLTAELRDVNNNVVTSDSSTSVAFAETSGTGSVTGLGSSTAASGVASKTVTGSLAGAVTISATASGLTSGTTTFTVVVGPAHHVTITSSTAALASTAPRTLTAEIRDVNENVVTSDNSTVVIFAKTAGAGTVTGLGSGTAAAGIASRTVTGSQAGSVTITGTGTTPGLTDGSTTFVVTTVPTFTDDPLLAQSTTVKAVHLTELRDAVATLRARYGLSVFSWTDATLTPGVTPIKQAHIAELRAALDAVYDAASRTRPTWSTIIAGTTLMSTAHVTDLRSAVLSIW